MVLFAADALQAKGKGQVPSDRSDAAVAVLAPGAAAEQNLLTRGFFRFQPFTLNNARWPII